jgi:hypothetical protein
VCIPQCCFFILFRMLGLHHYIALLCHAPCFAANESCSTQSYLQFTCISEQRALALQEQSGVLPSTISCL